jgi:site-specific recombinase
MLRKNITTSSILLLAEEIKSTSDTNRYATLFIELIAALRPTAQRSATESLQTLNQVLQQDKALQLGFQQMFLHLFNTKDSQSIFTSVGIQRSGTFFAELFRQLRHRILPPLPEKKSMEYLLQRAFYKKNDYIWVREIPDLLWIDFFTLVAGGMDTDATPLKKYLTNTLTVLSYRVSYLGLEEELNPQLKSQEEITTPFIEQNKSVQSFVHLVRKEHTSAVYISSTAQDVLEKLSACEAVIQDIRKNTLTFGTSLSQSYLLLRTEQQIKRMFIIIRFLTPEQLPQVTLEQSVTLFEDVVEHINKRYSIKQLYKNNSDMLAYQIAEHKSASGEHYITTTRSEYIAFFYAAAAGGVIIAFTAVIKALLHKIHMAPFWQHFCYGLNYAIAFVVLFITGASLATKQPTMTASALAGSLDSRKGGVSLQGLALNFAKVWRSQFAAFAGNLIVVFPLSYMLSVLWQWGTDTTLLHDKAEALQSLHDQNPTQSLAWFYACITGLCLFTSGIITGYVDNKVIYSNVADRMKQHLGLRKWMKSDSVNRLADFTHRSLGGIVGNVTLGFMLGYAGLIGSFFGIPFDIRHITISTAYFAFGVDGLENQLSIADWVWTTIGVIGIGFFNFLISFGLAFIVAIKSRRVPLIRLPHVGKLIWKYAIKYPLDFIYPPSKERSAKEVFDAKPKD